MRRNGVRDSHINTRLAKSDVTTNWYHPTPINVMFRVGLRRLFSTTAVNATTASLRRTTSVNAVLHRSMPWSNPSIPRSYCSNTVPNASPVSLQMINYALDRARSRKTDESYAEALLILEQGLTNQSQEGTDEKVENSKGMILLAISSLLLESGNTDEAMRALLLIQDLTSSSVGVKVAAMEALVGLNLELGLDDTSSVLADKCVNIFSKEGLENGEDYGYEFFKARSKAIKGLVELVQGDLESAKAYFEGCEDESFTSNAALSYGEYLHAKRDFHAAKELYQKAISESSEKKDFSDLHNLGACNMSSQEVLIAATCVLGQLESHLGNFDKSEEILTQALKKAEADFGTNHPKVGGILTCIALMYRHKATAEQSSSLLIQEGLFRKAIGLLKAPALDIEDVKGSVEHLQENVEKKDIVALARGGYAESLCVQANRKAEGERLKTWAESAWRNHRISLTEALDVSDSSCKVLVVDTRICRAL